MMKHIEGPQYIKQERVEQKHNIFFDIVLFQVAFQAPEASIWLKLCSGDFGD